MLHQRNNRIRLITVLALCMLALTMTLSLAVIAGHPHHDCRGAGCPVCLYREQAAAALRALSAAGLAIFLNIPGALGLCICATAVGSVPQPAGRTLVALRTRMDN